MLLMGYVQIEVEDPSTTTVKAEVDDDEEPIIVIAPQKVPVIEGGDAQYTVSLKYESFDDGECLSLW